MHRIKLLVVILFCGKMLFSQQSKQIEFRCKFGKEILQLNHYYKLSKEDSVQITNLKFYISNIEFYHDNLLVAKDSTIHHLIDLSTTNSIFSINQDKPEKANQVRFNIGIDSITNVSGALGGDLDPTKGMYWSWQSGYINFKLEGYSNRSPLANNFFEYHLGGYIGANNCMQSMRLICKQRSPVVVELYVDELLNNVQLETQANIMSPSADAVRISKLVKHYIRIK